MTRLIRLDNASSATRRDLLVDVEMATRPRLPDEADEVPDPRASRHASTHLAEGASLDEQRAQAWREQQQPHPTRRMVGPSMAERLRITQTTP